MIFDDYLKLLDPTLVANIELGNQNTNDLLKYFISMTRIRAVEKKLARAREAGVIKGPVHLGVGQEAIAVGVSSGLRKSDFVFGAHRSHAHALALGSSPRGLFAETLGLSTGLSGGNGGSMHLWDGPNGFMGSVPIVGGSISLAVGAGMAARRNGQGAIAVVYLGDGACEEGVFHESLNLASVTQSSILFVVENNQFASHMHWSERQPMAFNSRFAEAHGIPYQVIDGNNVVEVSNVSNKLIKSIRGGGGPKLLEAITYRWYGHVDWREDVDVGVDRSKEQIESWKQKDPIRRLRQAVCDAGIMNEKKLQILTDQEQENIDQDWSDALTDPHPEKSLPESILYK